MFEERNFTRTPVNQTAGKKLASEALKGRVFESNLGDLNNTKPHYKVKLIIEDASETSTRTALTNFYGIDTTRDYLCSLIKKWHTLIETYVDAKTNDGFLLRFFVIAATARNSKYQLKATSFAQNSQIKQIRRIMNSVISKEVRKSTLKELTSKVISESISDDITKKAKKIYPLQYSLIRKIKTLKKPRFDSIFAFL